MALHISIVLSAEWANDEEFIQQVKDCGHSDFLITYYGLDTDRKKRCAAEFAASYECQPYSDRKTSKPQTRVLRNKIPERGTK